MTSIEQHCRDLLSAAIAEGSVDLPKGYDHTDQDPQARSSGELVGMATLLAKIMREERGLQAEQSISDEKSVLQTVSQIIDVIPDGEPLKDELECWHSGVFIELPEDNKHLWVEAARIIDRNTPTNENLWNSWHYELVEIWTGKATAE